MAWLPELLTGPYGSLAVGLFVLAVELTVSRLVQGGMRQAHVSQTADASGGSNVYQSVDLSRTMIIQKVTGESSARKSSSAANTAQSQSADDSPSQVIAIYLGFAVIAGLVVETALAKYGALIEHVLVGVAAGSAITAIVVWRRARAPEVPVGEWAFVAVATSGALGYAATLLLEGSVNGVDVAAIQRHVGAQQFLPAMMTLQHEYGLETATFFFVKGVGAVLLLWVCLVMLVRLVGVVIAVAALNRPNVKQWHAWVVGRLYPSQGPWGSMAWGLFCVGFGLLLVSGIWFDLFAQLSTWSTQYSGAQ